MISLHTSLASLSNQAELPHSRRSPRSQPCTGYRGASHRQIIINPAIKYNAYAAA
jgi:hypothetical protein